MRGQPRSAPGGGGAPRGLRRTITLAFAVGGLLLAGVMSLGTYVTAREYLVDQRENVARQQAFADASFVRNGMLTETRPVSEVLGAASPPADSTIFVRRDDEWFSTSLTQTREVVPVEVREAVAQGRPVSQWGADEEGAFVAIGVPIPAVGADFFEVSRTPELQRTLNTLAWVLGGVRRGDGPRRRPCSDAGRPDAWSRRWTTSPAPPRGWRAAT